MTFSQSVQALAICIVCAVVSTAVAAEGPRGFRADWRRAEIAVTDALVAARSGNFDELRSDSDTANDALLDLSAYADQLPDSSRRAAYVKALEDARIAAQRAMLPDAAKTKDAGISAAQTTLQKVTTARAAIPADWLRPDACTGMRRQRRQC